jgi:hypothetical protein
MLNNIEIGQTIRELLISFDGAQIDFATGSVYASDGVTPLGLNFTPATIAAGQYRWYSVTAKSSTVNADKTVGLVMKVTAASADGASPSAAPKARFGMGIPLGMVCVQESSGSIANISASSIRQMNSSFGAYKEVTGQQTLLNNQANVDLTDMALDNAENKAAKVEYSIVRRQAPDDLVEQGSFSLVYKTSTATWSISGHTFAGDYAQVDFNITAGGQVQYTSSNLAGLVAEFDMRWAMRPL